MSYVLFDPRRQSLHDVVEEIFPVAPPLRWVETPQGFNKNWTFDGTKFAAPIPVIPNTEPTLNELRFAALEAIIESYRGNAQAPKAIRDYLTAKDRE